MMKSVKMHFSMDGYTLIITQGDHKYQQIGVVLVDSETLEKQCELEVNRVNESL